jgi:hypothetical protein
MPIAAPRRVGVASLLGLLAGALVLMVAPGDPGALRLAGIGLLWWYAAAVAPLTAVLVVTVVQRVGPATASRGATILAVAAWTSPVLLALVAARAFSGGPDAPALALTALVAPLLAWLGPPAGSERRPNVVAALAVSAAAGFILWANLLLFADVGGLLGWPRWAAGVLATLVALVTLELAQAPGVARRGGLALLSTSALGFVALVVAVALALAASPWGAWRAAASRSALTFSELSPWVTEGRVLVTPTALDFTETHRVTALGLATYRVLEPGRFREGQLRAGESLTLRAGDRLVLDAGARLRFEAGKRIPGSPASGIAWADPPERGAFSTVAETLGVLITLVGGALALVGVGPALGARAVYVGTGLLVALVLSSLCLGVFGAFAAPALSIGAPAVAAIFDLPTVIVPGPRGRVLGATGAIVLLVLFATTALALRDVLQRAWREPEPEDAGAAGGGVKLVRPIMRLFLLGAGAASLWGGEASRVLMLGLGLAASATLAPRLADGEPSARLAGSLVGAGAFVVLSILGSRLPTWAGIVGAYPVLAALPVAWGAILVLSTGRAPTRDS